MLHLQSHTETASPSETEYETPKDHHEISYPNQNNPEEVEIPEGERRFVTTVIDHRHNNHHQHDPTTDDHQTSGWTPLTPPPAPQTTAI